MTLHVVYRADGTVVSVTVDNGDGTGSRTRWDASGTEIESVAVEGLPIRVDEPDEVDQLVDRIATRLGTTPGGLAGAVGVAETVMADRDGIAASTTVSALRGRLVDAADQGIARSTTTPDPEETP